jgi:hypothetical protein
MMPPKKNPLKLNKLQNRTLLLMQELARDPGTGTPDPNTGEVLLNSLPHPHGNHVHIGGFVVSSRDASGFANESVWKALERKGLARVLEFPLAIMLTPLGQAYDTGLTDRLAHQSDH